MEKEMKVLTVRNEKQLTCKDCYYAGLDKCDHVKKLTKKQK